MTHMGYWGDKTIPEEKKEEFVSRTLHVLQQGGMFRKETVRLYEKEVTLLDPVAADEAGMAVFSHNYYEERDYETAGFDVEQAFLITQGVGATVFNWVLRATHVLREFYAEGTGIAWSHNGPFHAAVYIRWLNHLFREQYTNQRVANLWEIYQLLPEDQKDFNLFSLYSKEDTGCVPFSDVVKYSLFAADISITELVDRMTGSVEEEESDSISVSDGVLVFFKALQRFYQMPEKSVGEKVDRLVEILTWKRVPDDFTEHCDKEEWPIVLMGALLPREIVVKCVAEVFDIDAMAALQTWGKKVPSYDDGWTGIRAPFQPLPPMDTASFLTAAYSGGLALESDDNGFRITDDDRAFYWEEEGDVQFSEKMLDWMKALRDEMQTIRERDNRMDAVDCQKLLVEALVQANDIFGHIYCFKNVFYDFMARANHPDVQVAVVLLKELVDRNSQERLKYPGDNRWFRENRYQRQDRLEVKRYLAILGNLNLRRNAFAF